MRYVGFWDREGRQIIIGIPIIIAVIGLFGTAEDRILGLCFTASGVFLFASYLLLRKKFVHLRIVSRQLGVPGFFRSTSRAFISALPFLVYIGYTLLWLSSIKSSGVFQTCTDDVCDLLLKGLIAGVFLWSLPFLFAAYILWNLPIFFTREKISVPDLLSGTRVVYSTEKISWPQRILKIPVIFITLICIGLFATASLWAGYNIPGRQLNPEVETFFYDDPFVTEDNFYIAMNGFNAPAGTADIYDYGLKVFRKELQHDSATELTFKGDSDSYCYDETDFKDKKSCLSDADILRTFQDNHELIERYKSVYKYGRHSIGNEFSLNNPGGQNFISLHEFLPLYWKLMTAQDRGEEAIQWWIEDTAFIQKVQAGKHTVVEQAIWMINYGLNLKALPFILADPALALKYQEPVLKILSKEFPDPEIWNVPDTMRAEYNALRLLRLHEIKETSIVAIKPNDTRNKFLEMTKEFIRLSQLPEEEIRKQGEAYEKQLIPCITTKACVNAIYNPAAHFLLPQFFAGWHIMLNAHRTKARTRALALVIMARAQNVQSENMENFIRASDTRYYNPYTNRPFEWDPEKTSIFFNNLDTSRFDVPYYKN